LAWIGLLMARSVPRLSWKLLPIVIWGSIAPGLVLVLSVAGAVRSDGLTVAVMWGLVPICGPLLARLFLKETLHWSIPIAGCFSFAALLFVTLSKTATRSEETTLVGFGMILSAVILSSSTHIFGRRFNTGGLKWYQVACLQMTGAALTGMVAAAMSGWNPPDPDNAVGIAAILYLSLVMTLANFSLYNFALSRITAIWTAFYLSLGPAVGTVAAALILGTVIRTIDAIAVAAMIISTLSPMILRYRSTHRRVKSKSNQPLGDCDA